MKILQQEPQTRSNGLVCPDCRIEHCTHCKCNDCTTKNTQNEPQLSAIEKMALKYNIPLADLESLLATALEEQRAEFVVELMTKINLIIDQSKEHSCRFNDGDSNCECYLEGLNRIKRQFSFEHKCGIVDKIKEMKSGVLPDARQRGYNQAIDDVLAILNGKETE